MRGIEVALDNRTLDEARDMANTLRVENNLREADYQDVLRAVAGRRSTLAKKRR